MFNERGKFEEIANKLRAKAKLTLLQQEIASISRKTGISSESKLALIQPKKLTVSLPNLKKKQIKKQTDTLLSIKERDNSKYRMVGFRLVKRDEVRKIKFCKMTL